MKLASPEQVKKLRESGMRQKDKEFWNGIENYSMWLCWMGMVVDWLEKRAERSAKVKNSVSVNSENSEA
jgi:hypothetical protein